MRLCFAGCRLEVDARQLFRGGHEVCLSPKAFEALLTLVENRPRAMSKPELLERVWPAVFVSDASLARVVSEIREGLGEDAREGRIIRTVHGYGYAFAAAVECDAGDSRDDRAAAPRLYALISDARTLSLRPGEQILGRDQRADLILDSPRVSRRHARIVVDATGATLEDLGSKNGTFVRNERISGPIVLQDGDQVQVGRLTFVFRVEDPLRSTETEGLSASG